MRSRTPLEVKDEMVRDYARSYERLAGQAANHREIEALVLRDLAMSDAAHRVPRPASAASAEPRSRDGLAEELAKLGPVSLAAAIPRRRTLLDANPFEVSARWPYAMGRILRMVRDGSCPALVDEFRLTWLGYTMRVLPMYRWAGIRFKNPYFGLSDRDASRRFMRVVEDICDRSTGVLHHWWVK